jgi:hypothetical protein
MNLPDVQAPTSQAGNFLKLKDKESIRGVLAGNFHTFYIKWVSGKSIETERLDPDAKVRFRCNFITPDEKGKMTVKIWEFGYTIFEQLKGINSIYPLEETKIQIIRNGTGTDTAYQILPLVSPKDELTHTQKSVMSGLTLYQLERKSKSSEPIHHPVSEFGSETGDTDELPF